MTNPGLLPDPVIIDPFGGRYYLFGSIRYDGTRSSNCGLSEYALDRKVLTLTEMLPPVSVSLQTLDYHVGSLRPSS